MRAIARLLPPSYVFESMRAILAGKPAHVSSLLIGASLAVLYILLACWFFQGTYRHAVRTGLIARYSAETAS
jgi:ABC-2 type transport system permease protein